MSYPYVPGQEVISFDANGKIIVDNTYDGIFDDLKEDKSYQTVMRLQSRIYAKDFEGFKKIYDSIDTIVAEDSLSIFNPNFDIIHQIKFVAK